MYKAPTAEEISQGLRASIKAQLPGSDPWVWPNNLYVVTKTIAQALRGVYLRLEWLLRQAFAAQAEGEYLELHGAEIGVARLAASFAAGEVEAASQPGTSVANGTVLVRGDGARFRTIRGVVAAAASVLLPVRALEAGKAGNSDAGAPMLLETPIAGIGAVAVAADGLTGGADAENDASLRGRILLKKRFPPHGGSPAEYVGWARELAGITAVFVRRATPQPGEVTVLFMMHDLYPSGVPLPGDVSRLRLHLLARAPASARLNVTAPTAKPVDVTLALVPDTPAVRDAVLSELAAMFRRRAEPGTAEESFIFARSWVAEAVSMATGEERHLLTAPAADVVCAAGEIAVLGTVAFA